MQSVRPRGTYAAVCLLTDKDLRPRGTNGYTTSWGTNAHGKMAGVPPSRS